MKRGFWITASVLLTLLIAGGCKDMGTAPKIVPAILSVQPDSAAVGDTVTISGSNFGATQGGSTLTIGGKAATVLMWSDGTITAIVPAGALSTGIQVIVGGTQSNVQGYRIKGGLVGQVSFASSIQPIFAVNCALSGRHVPPSPRGGFNLTSYSGIMAGSVTFGTHVVTPGDSSSNSASTSAGSGIMKMLRNVNNPYGNFRMPQGGPNAATGLPDSLIVRIGTWIVQGAQNN